MAVRIPEGHEVKAVTNDDVKLEGIVKSVGSMCIKFVDMKHILYARCAQCLFRTAVGLKPVQ